MAKNFTKRTPSKASTTNFFGLVECPPDPAPTILHQRLILSMFHLNDFLISSAQGTVSSSMIRCFEDSEMMIMSKQRDGFAMCWEISVVFSGQHAAANQELCGGSLLLSVNLPGVFLQL